MDISSRHRRTLERIFTRPTPSDIRWSEIEALMLTLDIEVSERSGSRVALKKDGRVLVVHKPHPGSQLGKSAVRAVAEFLEVIGVTP